MLIVAATELEIAALRTRLPRDVDVLVTGVGMVAMAVHCSGALARGGHSIAINVGVCGAFDPALAPGTVVHVVRDRIAELGAEDGDAFRTFEELGLHVESSFCNAAPPSAEALRALPAVNGITVNTVHGCAASIAAIVGRLDPQVESMEGAAFMSACLVHRVRFAQVRAVSNVVEPRNRSAWRMEEAIANLTETTARIVGQL
jgi:futalosine hydrolase